MSEHRRKSPLPTHGGRAAARRAAAASTSRNLVEHAPVPSTSEPEPKPSRRLPKYLGRTTMAGILLATSGALVLHEEPPKQQTQTVATTTVPHTISRTGGDGVWLHDSAGLGTPLKVVMPEGSQFNVDCFVPGQDQVNGNAVWLEGDYNGTHGAVTDYYIDTHWNTTQDLVTQGIEQCGTQPAAAPAPAESIQGGDVSGSDLQNGGPIPEGQYPSVPTGCYFNFKWPKTNLTFSYEGGHRYYGNAWQAAKNWTDTGVVSIRPAAEGREGDIVIKDVSIESDEDGRWFGKVGLSEDQENNVKLIQQNPELVNKMELYANVDHIEQLDDTQKTYTFTHEIGHILGVAHFDDSKCGVEDPENIRTIMMSGPRTALNHLDFNKPQEHDVAMLRYLYGS